MVSRYFDAIFLLFLGYAKKLCTNSVYKFCVQIFVYKFLCTNFSCINFHIQIFMYKFLFKNFDPNLITLSQHLWGALHSETFFIFLFFYFFNGNIFCPN